MDDSAESESKKKYTISSQLRITKSVWFSSRNKFSCNVEFYNGKTTVTHSDFIKVAPSCGTTTDDNQRNGYIAEFPTLCFW
ncbi:hypothetical protein AGOR_G00163730 [Albula goreensis]|uniref:Immunoglobulin C1-set domain-containing protein n=1 Tax=Albula goreensis TaxID=1534307 RepID=A0A8T3CZB6_9TELE|nr:hypothetical protein AGOR_G00163730 [Albula goreensis]